jgi:hypothetical protein
LKKSNGPENRNGLVLFYTAAATLSVALWQWATVHANYKGNWTALYCTGSLLPHPPLVASERVYIFANSTGFDGQMYHYVAHDPFLRSNLKSYVDDPRLRYRRILVPVLAYTLALGRAGRIDVAYELVCLASIALLVYWSCLFSSQSGLSPAWGLAVLYCPAVLITVDRLVVDGTLAAFTAGFVLYADKPSWKLAVILACAAFTRETGLLLIAGYAGSLVYRRRLRDAKLMLLSAAPALAWYIFEWKRTTSSRWDVSFIPLLSMLRALTHPWKYPASTPLAAGVIAADYAALFGIILAFGICLFWFVKQPEDPFLASAILFVPMAAMVQQTDHWQIVYHFGRVYMPLLLLVAAVGAQRRNPWVLAPAALMLPRIGIQFVPQMLGVMRWI